MQKDILVAIMEDDLFSRNWMSLLLVRDWRIRLMGDIPDIKELTYFLDNSNSRVDILVADVDVFGTEFNFPSFLSAVREHNPDLKILCTGVRAEEHIIKYMNDENCCGYLLKQEIGFSLGWAISFAYDNHWLFTSSTLAKAHKMNLPIPSNKMVLAGRVDFPGFTDRETEVAKLAIIFSLGRRDLAEALKISDQWSYGMVSELYAKLGLGDILSGEVDPITYLGDNPVLLDRFQKIVDKLSPNKKAKDLETLAFHFLTMPEIL
ncbi:MAG: hypothetical protein MUO40_03100 [Anaerolineaceae bacterium]|nr:hypothetical protein [Anaerolineaceae bacterium]